ncbi:MAG: class I SAM-dependent methyltransferase [Bacteroidia bacterium]|jgi:SAM-dependent methyltransferase|nr:class I SAM-dependent methyltransferase [Bacteroidia bacterium]GIV23635.1 MAG: hypothetical protein KatS3mg025_1294 [Bacteroidia bacterium]
MDLAQGQDIAQGGGKPNLLRIVQESPDIPESVKYYWGYQFGVGEKVIVPYLQKCGYFQAGMAVAEVGCGEAGGLMAFGLAGAGRLLGTDIEGPRLAMGRQIAHKGGIAVELRLHNILTDPIPAEWQGQFDIVLLRDVLEHLENPQLALENIGRLLRPKGMLYINFPAYPSPYGGHQHLLRNVWGKLPFIHLLPEKYFKPIAETGSDYIREELLKLHRIRLSLPQMPRIAQQAGYKIVSERHYFLRPVYRFKWKVPLPVVPITFIARRMPRLAQYFCMEAGYILQWQRGAEETA